MLLSEEGALMVLLVHPKIGVLHEILLLLTIVVLRHRPKVKILVLRATVAGVAGVLVGGSMLLLGVRVADHSPGHHDPLVLHLGQLSPERFVLFYKISLLASVVVDLGVLVLDDLGHFVDLLLESAVFGVDLDDDLFVG